MHPKPKLLITNTVELVASIPHVLGFHPDNSLVVVATSAPGATYTGPPFVRVDLPADVMGVLELIDTLLPVLAVPGAHLILLAYHPDEDRAAVLLDTIATALGQHAAIGQLLIVAGDHLTDIQTLDQHTLTLADLDRVATQMIAFGAPPPYASRADMQAAATGDATSVTAALRDLDPATIAATTPAQAIQEIDGYRHQNALGYRLADTDIARVLLLLDTHGVEGAARRIDTDTAPDHRDLWADVVLRTPQSRRGNAAQLLALAEYLRGHGAGAWIALDLLTSPQRELPLPTAISAALQAGRHPTTWNQPEPQRGTRGPVGTQG